MHLMTGLVSQSLAAIHGRASKTLYQKLPKARADGPLSFPQRAAEILNAEKTVSADFTYPPDSQKPPA